MIICSHCAHYKEMLGTIKSVHDSKVISMVARYDLGSHGHRWPLREDH